MRMIKSQLVDLERGNLTGSFVDVCYIIKKMTTFPQKLQKAGKQ